MNSQTYLHIQKFAYSDLPQAPPQRDIMQARWSVHSTVCSLNEGQHCSFREVNDMLSVCVVC